jgi:glutamine---fructose-6-phosphate transaminase (isomerizing)
MCGIFGYIGKRDSREILISGLKALEYRGYDSAGIFICNDKKSLQKRSVGRVKELERKIGKSKEKYSIGIAHTRWATHGEPSVKNAHPHADCDGNIFVVHNGVIENNKELRETLTKKGHKFSSNTDTEVIAHLIEEFMKGVNDFEKSLISTLKVLKGAYAVAVIDKRKPDIIYASRFSSPLIFGIGDGEYFLSSDKGALVGYARKVIHLEDGDVMKIGQDVYLIKNNNKAKSLEIDNLDWNIEKAQKGKFKHFMLKEIFEIPETIKNTLKGRLKPKKKIIKLGGLESIFDQSKKIKRLVIVSCGTSYYSGLIGEYLFEELAGIPTEVHSASEFRYRTKTFKKDTAVLFISQSGETADTLGALKKAKEAKLLTLGIVNVIGSTIARETDAGVYNHVGPEIGVASTKAFVSQVVVLILMALYNLPKNDRNKLKIIKELDILPPKIERVLERSREIEKIAKKYYKANSFFYIGRRFGHPLALEGALKLKEISYIHAEGYEAGEMKHGPIALIDKDFPTFAIATDNPTLDKTISNIEEIKSRKGPVIAIATKGNREIKNLVDYTFFIPKVSESVEVLLVSVVLQLFAYYIALAKGCDIDKPRNLAKSVTVE